MLLAIALITFFARPAFSAEVVKEAGANKVLFVAVPTNMVTLATNSATPQSYQGVKAYDISLFNTGSSDVYCLIFDSRTNALTGDRPSTIPVKVPAGEHKSYFWTGGRNFQRGITIGASTTPVTFTNAGAVLTIDVAYYDQAY